MITNIAVDFNGDIYLECCILPNIGGSCLSRFDKYGKWLNSFGPQGPITPEDINKAAILSPENEPCRGKFLRSGSGSFSIVDGYLEFIQTDSSDTLSFSRIDGRTGKVLDKESIIPVRIEQAITDKKVKNDVIWENHHSQKRIEGIVCAVIDRNGEFYYMSVRPDILTIWKVNFKKP